MELEASENFGKSNGYKRKQISLSFIVLVIGYAVHLNMTCEEGPIVDILNGKLEGNWAVSRQGKKYSQFLAIPYAKPPVGSLRFEPPEAPDSWDGIRQADKLGPECSGFEFITSGRVVGQEDCLYLNVYTPVKVNGSVFHQPLLPVIVYIHGGAFLMGSTKIHGAKYFMDEEVILVTINYRLAAFGFLNTGDGVVLGNMGLKDQTLALRWVKDNIITFGGNPSQVTLVGESAGAVSVHLHMLSSLSKGLFHRAVSISGSASNFEWALERNHSETAEELGKKLNCPTYSSRALVNCLKNLPATAISATHLDTSNPLSPLKNFYTPSLEVVKNSKSFLTESPLEIQKSGKYNLVPWIAGLNEYEGLVYISRLLQNDMDLELFRDEKYRNDYLPQLLFLNEEERELSHAIFNYYFNSSKQVNTQEITVLLANLFSDRFFVQGVHNSVLEHSKHSQAYLYLMTYRGRINLFNLLRGTSPTGWIPFELRIAFNIITIFISSFFGYNPNVYGSSHGDDVPLLFNFNDGFTDITPSSADFSFSCSFIKLLVDFSKDLKPMQFKQSPWYPAQHTNQSSQNEKENQLTYLKLDTVPQTIPDPFAERVQFWNSLGL